MIRNSNLKKTTNKKNHSNLCYDLIKQLILKGGSIHE